MLRRSVSLLLAIVLVLGMLPMTARAEQPSPEEPELISEESIPLDQTEPSTEGTTVPETEEPTVPETEETTVPETEETTVPETEETTVPETEGATIPETEETTVPETEETEPALEDPTVLELVGPEIELDEEEAAAHLDGFVYSLFFDTSEVQASGIGPVQASGIGGRDRLSAANKYLYDELKKVIVQIALGNRTSTTVTVDLSTKGYSSSDFDPSLTIEALYLDSPFEMYWYRGYSCTIYYISDSIDVRFLPATNYQPANYNSKNPTINTYQARRAATAANNAKAIARQYAGYSDYNKLCAFTDKICSLVSYDYYAADNDIYDYNINPWTLVNVFDNDPSTNVVCAGYSEAFQYLCNLSTFKGDVQVYLASGNMHQWNIIRIDGLSYLMDVTHCDHGTVATRGPKFFGGGSGSIEKGYVIGGFHYWYYDESKKVYGTGPDSILKLAPTSYRPGAKASTMTQAEFEKALASCRGSYTLTKGVTLTSSLTLENVKLTIASGAYIAVNPDAALTVAKSASVTVSASGSLHLNKDAALFKFGTVSGRVTGEGTVCDTVIKFADYMSNHLTGMSKAQIRSRMQSVDKQETMTELLENSNGYGFFFDVEKIEKAVGGPAKVNISADLTDLAGSSTAVVGACLNTPLYSNIPIQVNMEAPQGSMNGAISGFRLTLEDSRDPVKLDFPVCVTMQLPSKLQSSNLILTNNGTTRKVDFRFEREFWKISFVTDTLGDFFLSYPTSGSFGDNITWNLNQDTGHLSISGSGSMPDAASQDKVPWNVHNSTIQSVTVGEGITNLTGYAFKNAKNLKSVSLPEGLTAIGYGAFLNCDQLTGLSLPNTVQTIGDFAFEGCSGLTELVLPVSLKSLGKNAFYKASSLKNVFFLGDAPTQTAIVNPFLGVTADAYYPNGSSTWTDAVRNSLGSGLNWKPSGNGGGTCGEKLYWLFDLDNGVLNITGTGNIQDCTGGAPWKALADGITAVRLDSRITGIGAGAFAGLPNLTRITIPGGVATLGAGAFRNCTGLSEITLPKGLTQLESDVFRGCTGLETVVLPVGLTGIGTGAFAGCAGLKDITLPTSVETIGASAFEGCTGLEALTLNYTGSIADSDKEYSIGSRAFAGCTGLMTLKFGQNVPEIAADAFTGVKALAFYPVTQNNWNSERKLPYGGNLCWVADDPSAVVRHFSDDLHWSVNTNGVLRIFGFGTVPADACTLWADAEITSLVNTEITSVILEQGVTGIGANAFRDMATLRAFTAASVTTFDATAFRGCTGLETVAFADGLTEIPAGAFDDCAGITRVILPDTLQRVEPDAFGTNPETRFQFDGSVEQFIALFGTDRRLTADEGTFLTMRRNEDGVIWALADGGTLYLFGSASVNANIDEAWQEQVRHVVLREGAEHLNLDLTVFPGVTELTMPATVTDAAIYAGSSLERVHIPDFASWAKIDFRKDANPLCVAARLYTDGQRVTSFQLPAGAEKIGSYAFQGAKLDSLYIPDSVTSVGEGAFLDCRGMKITYAGSSEAWMRICTNCSLTVACQADGVTLCGFGSCGENLTWSITGDGTLVITGTGAMDDFGNDARAPWEDLEDDIKALQVEEGVTGIGECAFYGCGKLESVSLPSSLTEIRYSAFEYCSRLTSLILPAKLETVGSRAFANCCDVKSVFIPKSVTSIGRYAFDGCIPTTVTIEDLDSWCAIEFGGICANPISSNTETLYLNGSNTPVTEITVPASVSDYAFQYCKVLKKVNIPAGAKIGADAFSGCTNAELYYGGTLEQWPETGYTSDIPVNFSDGTRVLGCGVTDPAGGHDNIRWVVSESGELRLSGEGELFLDDWGYENGSPWFRMTDRITSVVVEPGVTSLCAHTFRYLEHVTAIVIGPDVKTIAGGAFDQEGMSATVIFQGCPAQIGPDNFTGQTLWAYYRPSDGWKSAQLGRYQATNLFWIPYTDQDAIFDVPTTGFKLTAKAAVPSGGLKQPGSTVMLVYGPDKKVPINPANLIFSIPESQQNIATVDGQGVITAGSLSGTVTVTAALRDDPQQRKVSVSVKIVGAAPQSLLLIPEEDDLLERTAMGEDGDKTYSQYFIAWYNVAVNQDRVRYEGHRFLVRPKLVNEAECIVPVSKSSLRWSTTDSKIATVTPNADGTATVYIRPGAVGACGITAVTNDAVKVENTLVIHVRDYKPCLESTSFTLNTSLEKGTASVRIMESYDNKIRGCTLHEYNSALKIYEPEASTRLTAQYDRETNTITIAAKKAIPNSTLKLLLKVRCSNGEVYEYPITVKIANSVPNVVVKQLDKFNLFYKDSTTRFSVSAGNAQIRKVELDSATTSDFVGSYDGDTGLLTVSFSQSQQVSPSTRPDTKADLLIFLTGYQEPLRRSISIAATTVKPKLSVSPAASVINTGTASNYTAKLYVYDHTAQQYLSDYQVTANFATVSGPYLTGYTNLTLKAPYTGGTASIVVQPSNWTQPITLTHKVTVSKALPAPTLSAAQLTLNSTFPDREATAQIGLNQCNLRIKDVTIVSDAKYGSAAAVESDKILCAYDAKRNTICASIPDPDNTPRSGTYAFRYVVTLDDAAQTRLPSKTFKIKVESTVPTVKLRSGTLKLNTQQGAGAYDQTAVTVTGNTGLELVDLRTPNGWSSRDIRIAYDPQTGMLSAHLENEDAAVGTQSISLLPVVRRTDTGEDTVLRGNPVKVTVQVYSAKPSVSVSAKGKLDTIVPGSAITYTMRLKNLVGAVEAARLEGTDSQLFDVQPDAEGGVVLTIAEGAQCSTKTTYKLNLIVQIGGQEYPIGISFRVSQSKLKCTASGAMTLFQSQSDPLTGRFTLASPAGVCVQSIAVSGKTDRNLLKAIGKCGLGSPELLDGGVVEFNLGVANPGSLVKGKRYTLCLEVTPAGNASDAAPTYLSLSVQVR